MIRLTRRAALACALAATLPALAAAQSNDDMHMHEHIDAGDFILHSPYVRAAGAMARSGAAFMGIENIGDTDDRLVAVLTDVAVRPELHTHVIGSDGVAVMKQVEEGFVIPAGEVRMLERGGDHIMLMGLQRALHSGDKVRLTLVFENAGEVTVEIPVHNERGPMHEGMGQQHKHGMTDG